MEAFWPGPLTLILKKQAWVPSTVTGGQDTVGLRVPGHPVALELLRRFAADGGPGGIAAPSANRFGHISPTTADHVREELGDRVPMILDGGPCAVGIESTIVELFAPRARHPAPGAHLGGASGGSHRNSAAVAGGCRHPACFRFAGGPLRATDTYAHGHR